MKKKGLPFPKIIPGGRIMISCAFAAQINDEIAALRAACSGLLPRGWRDGTMDHMPGVKKARLALAKHKGK